MGRASFILRNFDADAWRSHAEGCWLVAVYLIGLGYPANRPLRPIGRPDRPPLDDVVHWDHW
jgi:nitroreductase